MLRDFIGQAVRGEDLSADRMTQALELILSGRAKPSQVAAFLVALRLKGETVQEITAAAEVVRRYGPKVRVSDEVVVLDRDEINLDEETINKVCALNGSGDTRTFNISTASALVAAGGGLKVAKFGSRAKSTFCGSANVVGALGVNLDLTVTEVERCLEEVGLGFLYAHLFHTPLALATRVREEIGVRTIFNLVGPLTNPAGGRRQVLGVYLPERAGLMAQVLGRLGVNEALVVYGQDTQDELSVTGPSLITRLRGGAIEEYEVAPEDVGLARARPEELRGGGAEENARLIREVIGGGDGARRDVVLLNAGAAFLVSGRARDLKEGLEMARESIDSGRARAKLDQLVAFTAQCGVYQHKDVS
ncbi:MAG: anthranilate phosphoribosyltransferase [Thermodesulfobacteriota bacterium]